jgi:hypothetical protein
MATFRNHSCALATFGILLAASYVAAACASAPRPREAQRCEIAEDHPALTNALTPVYRDCDVDVAASARETPLSYTPSAVPRTSTCLYAEALFIVNVDGRPEPGSIEIVRNNDPALGGQLASAVRGWRYTPAQKDGQPVRQLVRSMRAMAIAVTAVPAGVVPSASRTQSRSAARAACPS